MGELARAAELVTAGGTVAMACHVHPDGDALGSLLAMRLLCEEHGVDAVASWGEPFTVAPHYRFLPGLDRTVPPHQVPVAPDVMVVFDCSSLDRLGSLADVARKARELVVLDHHDDNPRYGTVNVVVPDAAATAVIVRRLAEELGWRLTHDVAKCLYVGLITDTGRFQYVHTPEAVFHLAEELATYDLPIAEITRELFEKHRFAYVQLAAMALSRAELDPGLRFIAAWVTAEDLARYDVAYEETEGLIDLVRRTAEADVSCVLKEAPGEGLRVSLRSIAGTDVGSVARRFGGGGHRHMAGFVTNHSIPETIERLKASIAAAP